MRTFSKSSYDFSDYDTVSIIDELSLWSAPFGMKLLDAIKLRQNISVLDIGPGLGFPAIEIANRLGRSCKVYGIDPWATAMKIAKKKIDIFNMVNIELIEGVAEEIPLPDSSIDLIVSNNGINNVQDLNKVFKECSRVTKPGAQFVATVNLADTMIEFYEVFEEVLSEFNLKEVIPELKQHIYNKRRPAEEYEKLFNDNGFMINRISKDSFKYRFNDGTAMFDYPFIQYAFMDSWLSLVPENRVNDVFPEIEKRMNIISHNNGEWSLTIPFITIDAAKR